MDFFKYFRVNPPAPRLTQTPQTHGGFFSRFGMGFRGGPSLAGVTVSERTAFTLPAVLSAVSDITGSLSSIPLELIQVKDGVTRRATEHPAGQLFSRSPDGGNSTGVRFRASLLMHSLVWGNGYCEIGHGLTGNRVYLFLLDPERMQILLSPEGIVSYQYGGKVLPRESIVHLSGLGFDGIDGFPTVQLVKQALGLGIGATQFAGAYIGNANGVSGFFKPPGDLKAETRDEFIKNYEERHAGPESGGKVGMLPPGWDWLPTTSGSNPASAELSDLRREAVLDVARIFRLPPHRLGITDGQSYASIEAQNRAYVDGTLVPLAQSLEEVLNLRLLTDEEVADGYTFRHDFSALLRADSAARAALYTTLFNTTAISPNEIREREGMNPRENGDVFLTALNLGVMSTPDKKETPK